MSDNRGSCWILLDFTLYLTFCTRNFKTSFMAIFMKKFYDNHIGKYLEIITDGQ